MQSAAADLILISGKLWDGKELPGQQAIAIGSGRILAVGTDRAVQRHQSDGTRLIDADGRRVIPGLIDSHIHMVRAGLSWNTDVHWNGVTSRSDALELIARAAALRDPSEWIAVIGGWNPYQFTDSQPPTRADLDEAAPEHPVFVQRNYIEALLNTRALQDMGWVGTGSPEWVETDSDSGEPTGRVTGGPALQQLKERLSTPVFEEQVEGTRAMIRELNRVGLTGAIDTGGFGMTPDAYRPVTELYRGGEHGFRARLLVGASQAGSEISQLEEWMRLVSPGAGDDYVRYLGAGEVLLFGAHDLEGLDARDVTEHTTRLAEVSRRLIEAGWPVHIHAILDRSISSVLNAWQQTGRQSELADLRYTITHADQIGPDNLRRVSEMGIGVTVQNGMAFRGGDSIPTWGLDRVRQAPPLRAMLELGIPMGAGTDGTVVSSFNPWHCIRWMVSGQSEDGSPSRLDEQRLTRDEALGLYTRGSAWFSFEETTRGNLGVGSLADIVVLSDDPLTVDEREIPLIESVLTIVGGEVVHTDGTFERQR